MVAIKQVLEKQIDSRLCQLYYVFQKLNYELKLKTKTMLLMYLTCNMRHALPALLSAAHIYN